MNLQQLIEQREDRVNEVKVASHDTLHDAIAALRETNDELMSLLDQQEAIIRNMTNYTDAELAEALDSL